LSGATPDQPFDQTEAFVRAFLRAKKRRLARLPGFNIQDLEDLGQDLCLELVAKWLRYDPARGSPRAFQNILAERALSKALRRRSAQMRNPVGVQSLSAWQTNPDGDPTEMAAALDQHAHDGRLRRRTPAEQQLAERRLDVAAVLADLTPAEQDLARRLTTHTVAEIARATDTPTSTVAAQVRRLRRFFEARGLGKFLGTSSSSRTATG
jgi:RNA polymerase sigma factor (sigma-70 family)